LAAGAMAPIRPIPAKTQQIAMNANERPAEIILQSALGVHHGKCGRLNLIALNCA
jgi:hypothetical protein